MGIASAFRYAAAAALLSAPVHAPAAEDNFGTGNTFYASCSAGRESARWQFCWGYVRGIAEGTMASTPKERRTFCAPADVNVEQMVDITIDYMRRHPIERNEPTSFLVDFALTEAFPCPQNKSGK